MKLPFLYLITNKGKYSYSNIQIIEEAIKGGIKWIQLRDKKNSLRNIFTQALVIRKITKEEKVIFIINDSIEIALAVEAEGVHLGKKDLPVKVARKLLGKNKIIGYTCKNIDEAYKAQAEGVDYISIGPIFKSTTKPQAGKALGVNFIKEIKKHISLPLVTIGGININNLSSCFENGADSIAVASAITEKRNIKNATYRLIEKIKTIKKI